MTKVQDEKRRLSEAPKVSIRKKSPRKFLRAAQRYLVSAWGHSEMIATAAKPIAAAVQTRFRSLPAHRLAHPFNGEWECIGTSLQEVMKTRL